MFHNKDWISGFYFEMRCLRVYHFFFAAPLPPPGVQVWVGNLPKKRNVERDLRAGLKGAEGLIHILPATSGSSKTRDPTCVGHACLTFSTRIQAER